VIGCAVAYRLAREGLAVTLLEGGEIGAQASGAAAGMLAPASEAEGPGPLLRLGLESLALYPAWAAELRARSGIDPELERCGVLRVAESPQTAEALARHATALPEAELTWLDAAALRAAEPALAPGLAGALLAPGEAHVRTPLLVRALAAAAAGAGARLEAGTPVVGLLRDGARVTGVATARGPEPAGAVVLCTGSWTAGAAAWVEPAFAAPVVPVRGQIVALDAPRPPLARIVWGEGAYLVPRRDGSVAVGATVERVGFDCRVTAEGVRALLAGACALAPALAGASFRGAWAGLRPDTPDHLPLVGPVPGLAGLFLAAGHYRNGVLLAPLTGDLVAEGLAGKPWRAPALLPSRFT